MRSLATAFAMWRTPRYEVLDTVGGGDGDVCGVADRCARYRRCSNLRRLNDLGCPYRQLFRFELRKVEPLRGMIDVEPDYVSVGVEIHVDVGRYLVAFGARLILQFYV